MAIRRCCTSLQTALTYCSCCRFESKSASVSSAVCTAPVQSHAGLLTDCADTSPLMLQLKPAEHLGSQPVWSYRWIWLPSSARPALAPTCVTDTHDPKTWSWSYIHYSDAMRPSVALAASLLASIVHALFTPHNDYLRSIITFILYY